MSDDWTPYVVRAGDYVLKVANRLGFDAEQVWSDARNERLRSVRGSPNVLCSGDVLYVPSPTKRWLTVNVGAVNAFTVQVPTAEVSVTFVSEGRPVAGQACRIHELPKLTALKTDSNGALSFSIPATLDIATVEFTNLSLTQTLHIGGLDPATEDSGVIQRLYNLGFLKSRSTEPGDGVIAAARAFRRSIGESGEGALDDEERRQLEKVHGC